MDQDGPKPGQPVVDVVLPTFIMNPSEDELFYPSAVKKIMDEVVKEKLFGKAYDEDDSKEWVVAISDTVKARVKAECHCPRYKLIVQTTIGEMKDQGVRVASRCLWDTATDNYASTDYKNERSEATSELQSP